MTGGPYILIVDDDTMLLKALSEMLSIHLSDLLIHTAESGPAAIERIMETDYDVVVTDLKMPAMDGLTLVDRIRAIHPDTPILIITGHGEHDLAIRALRAGAYDYIQKPFDRDYFVASLKRALQMRQLSRLVEEQRRSLKRYASSLEQMVGERTRKLEEANRVKDEFLSTASHELRSPLTSLRLYMQLAELTLERGGVPLPPQWERMNTALTRLESLINDLVDAVRITSGKLALRRERFDVRELCTQVASDQEASSGRPITVNVSAEPLEIEGDVDRLGQVFTNLLANAIRYSPPDRPVFLNARRSGEELLVGVEDRGLGIPSEHLPHIFERFYQVPGIGVKQGPRVGLGLGLFICREIVERHGGRISAESALGQGSRFTVVLRLAPPVKQRATARKAARSKSG